MTADRKGPSDDDKRGLIEEMQRAWSEQGTTKPQDAPLSFANECMTAALSKWSPPPAPDQPSDEEIELAIRNDGLLDDVFAASLGVSEWEVNLDNWIKAVRLILAKWSQPPAPDADAVERLIEAAELAAGHLCRVAQRATDVGSKRHAQIRADDLTKALAAVRSAQPGGRRVEGWAIVNDGPVEVHAHRWSAEGSIARGKPGGRLAPATLLIHDTQPGGRMAAEEARCQWTEDSEGVWETECGGTFEVNDGKPDENDMRFCCYCGEIIAQMDYCDDDA